MNTLIPVAGAESQGLFLKNSEKVIHPLLNAMGFGEILKSIPLNEPLENIKQNFSKNKNPEDILDDRIVSLMPKKEEIKNDVVFGFFGENKKEQNTHIHLMTDDATISFAQRDILKNIESVKNSPLFLEQKNHIESLKQLKEYVVHEKPYEFQKDEKKQENSLHQKQTLEENFTKDIFDVKPPVEQVYSVKTHSIPRDEIVQTVQKSVSEMVSDTEKPLPKSVVLHLDPPELGPVHVKVRMHEGQIFVELKTENMVVSEHLKNHMSDLTQHFKQEGIVLSELSFHDDTKQFSHSKGSHGKENSYVKENLEYEEVKNPVKKEVVQNHKRLLNIVA
jgi:flagellar hook-length control protein FliK